MKNDENSLTQSEYFIAGLIAFFLFVVIVVFAPIATITAFNVLFGLSIPTSFITWLSAFWLHILLLVSIRSKGK